jgi:methylglyoxal synthase
VASAWAARTTAPRYDAVQVLEWFEYNYKSLVRHRLVCTGTTGRLIEEVLQRKLGEEHFDYHIEQPKSGPLGGDQQLGAMITERKIDAVILLWDPMQPHPHDVDVKALLRIAALYNVPIACNRAAADFLMSAPLRDETYVPMHQGYRSYTERPVDL